MSPYNQLGFFEEKHWINELTNKTDNLGMHVQLPQQLSQES